MNGDAEVRVSGAGAVRRVVRACVTVEIALVLCDVVLSHGKSLPTRSLRALFNVAREDSLANWFASTQTLLVAVVLGATAAAVARDGASRRRAGGWGVLAAFFAYLAVDDALGIHEKIGSLARRSAAMAWFPSYAWQVVFAPVLGGMLLLMLALGMRGPGAAAMRRWLLAGLAALGLAVALDFVEGMDGVLERLARASGLHERGLGHFMKVTEELLEMLGTTALLGGFASHLAYVLRGRRWVLE